MSFWKLTAAAVATLVIAGCAQQEEEEVMMVEEEPIFAKDGTIIGMRPVVGSMSSGGSSSTMDPLSTAGESDDGTFRDSSDAASG